MIINRSQIETISIETAEMARDILLSQSGTIALESSDTAKNDHWSIIVWDSEVDLKEADGNVISKARNGKTIGLTADTPLEVLEKYLSVNASEPVSETLPFTGGWVGYFSYEAAQWISPFKDRNTLEKTPKTQPLMPHFYWGFYTQAILINHPQKRACFVSCETKASPLKTWQDIEKTLANLSDQAAKASATTTSEIKEDSIKKDHYINAIKRIKTHIKNGDIYQANYSHRISMPFEGQAHHLYHHLKTVSPAPYSAFIQLGDIQILSSSPECLFEIKGQTIQTRPIKGTIKRGQNQAEDAQNKAQLLNSIKDDAELLMITDLERNDLGKICDYGSITVPQIKTLEQYEQVFHLVSTINGCLKDGIKFMDVIHALFPGGSITGAPKCRAMEILNDLEKDNRHIYTGSIGYLDQSGNAAMNIAIRSLYTQNNTLTMHVGGGIVADSDPESEWEETQAKAAGMRAAIEAYKLSNEGKTK